MRVAEIDTQNAKDRFVLVRLVLREMIGDTIEHVDNLIYGDGGWNVTDKVRVDFVKAIIVHFGV